MPYRPLQPDGTHRLAPCCGLLSVSTAIVTGFDATQNLSAAFCPECRNNRSANKEEAINPPRLKYGLPAKATFFCYMALARQFGMKQTRLFVHTTRHYIPIRTKSFRSQSDPISLIFSQPHSTALWCRLHCLFWGLR
jgi:hypothetical protein